MTLVLAHVGGFPVEELLPLVPALVAGLATGGRLLLSRSGRAGPSLRSGGKTTRP